MKRVAAVVVLALVASAEATAANCYRLVDRKGEVVYQGWVPPLALDDAGRREREASRARGEHLVFFPAPICPEVQVESGGIDFTVVTPETRVTAEDAREPPRAPRAAPSRR